MFEGGGDLQVTGGDGPGRAKVKGRREVGYLGFEGQGCGGL